MIFSLTGKIEEEISNSRCLLILVNVFCFFILSACGVLFCVDTTGKLYTMEARVMSQNGKPIESARFYFSGNGVSLFRRDGSFLGGDGILTDSLGKVEFSEYSKNYPSCESAPDFETLAPLTIMVVNPQFDTAIVILTSEDLKNIKKINAIYVLPDLVMQEN